MRSTGNLYAAARFAANMTVTELASTAGVSSAVIRKVEKSEDFDVAGMREISEALRNEAGIKIDAKRFKLTFFKDVDDFGRLVAVGRSAAGMKQSDLAEASKVSIRTISGLENGSSTPTTAVRDALVACLARRGIIMDVATDDKESWEISIVAPDEVLPSDPIFPGATFEDAVAAHFDRAAADFDHPHMLRLRIEVDGTDPLVWREILIPENATFADLHSAIQISFGWKWAHLHAFHCGVLIGDTEELNSGASSDTRALDEHTITLQSIDHSSRVFHYIYDFGDRWVHTIKIGGRVPRADLPARPVLVDGAFGSMIEDSGSYEGFNRLVADIRNGDASMDILDWLHQRGYGRDYDPNSFDRDLIDKVMGSAPFDIPKTWNAEFKRSSEMIIAVNRNHARPAGPSRFPGRSMVVTSVDEFTVEDFRRDGVSNPDQGMLHALTTKREDRVAPMRYELDNLAHLLDLSNDVATFQTFPLAIRWRDGEREGVFHPDIRIIDQKGDERVLHIAFDDEEAEFARRLCRDHGIEMTVVTSGFLGRTEVENCEEVCRWRRWGLYRDKSDIYLKIAEFLGKAALSKGIPMPVAAKLLADNGFDIEQGVQGGTPEGRAKVQICAAIADGLIGLDYRLPFDETVIGLPKRSTSTLGFWKLLSDYKVT
ncbi:helix-turn-helix domain-containing protein [Agrobacterium rubi]|nr:helix-turn-helix domain-containing protein [Agrobacterium rubi]NTF23704.1 helix-turn-helix domain-containing protein [Agrobacterium rubi]